ncbi:MAG TPA: AAA family ATPase [Candidatus Xenobia bacterium]|jgi:hypothetical protein
MTSLLSPFDRVLDALGQRVRSLRDHQADALCPAHEDRAASLSVDVGRNGGAVVTCQAGCTTEAVVEALGLKMRDLFPPPSSNGNGAVNQKGKAPGNGSSKLYTLAHIQRRPQVTAIYHYGPDLLKVRIEEAGKAKTFAWYRSVGHDQWTPGTAGAEKALYRSDEVRHAIDKGRVVFVVEGEKDVDTALSLGLVATSSPDGASRDAAKPKFPAHLAEPLRGAKRVVIIADNDEAGRAHARATLDAVLPVVAGDVRILQSLPGVADHGDLTDWIQAGGTKKELEALVRRAQAYRHGQLAAPVGKSPATETAHTPTPQGKPKGPTIFNAAALMQAELRPTEIVVPTILPAGLGLLGGRPKKGKSWLALGLALAVSAGGRALGQIAVEAGDTLYLDLEGAQRRTQKRIRTILGEDPPSGRLSIA